RRPGAVPQNPPRVAGQDADREAQREHRQGATGLLGRHDAGAEDAEDSARHRSPHRQVSSHDPVAGPPTEPYLRFDGVAIRLGGKDVVSLARLDVARGEFVCIVGPSGCGKTTLLRAAAGLLRPAEGEVRRNGRLITEPSREMAMVFQDYGRALLPWRTVDGNVALALEAAGTPRGEWPGRIADALRKVGL